MVHKKLDVYKLAVKFVGKIYNLSGSFPKDERYGITSQIRRAAVSIPLNIAEGSSRKSIKEFTYYLSISLGSANEIEAILDILIEINYCTGNEIKELSIDLFRIRKMLQAMINKKRSTQ